MRALLASSLSDDYSGCVLADVPIPVPARGELLIRVMAAAVNFVDLLITKGAYQKKPDLPFVLGSDSAGVIVAIGDGVEGYTIGQSVVGMQLGGAFAEYVVLRADAILPKPNPFTFGQGAAFGAAYYTAYVALTRRTRLGKGDWLLVHGASGGVGLAAVDVGRALGAKVIAASASPAKLSIISGEYTLDATVCTSGPFREEVLRITAGRGANVIFDPVGGDVFGESIRCIAFAGDYLVVGFTSGRIPTITANMPLIKGFSLVGVRAGEYGRRFPEHGRADRLAVWTLANAGSLKPRVHETFALKEWRAAFEAVVARQVVGRVVLDMAEESI